jgi:hypothetical protein
MTYLDLVTSHIRRSGGDDALVSAVEDYLKNGHPDEKPPWSRQTPLNLAAGATTTPIISAI